jgi:uncharacterized protein YggT (Ycf19 family)
MNFNSVWNVFGALTSIIFLIIFIEIIRNFIRKVFCQDNFYNKFQIIETY